MNNVNYATARAFKAAILHTMNNFYRPRRWGAIQALLSPSLQMIRSQFSPYSIGEQQTGGTSMNWVIPGGRQIPCPQVILNYRPAYALTADNERLRTGADPAGLTSSVDLTVTYDYFKQKQYTVTPSKVLLEDKAMNYIDEILKGNLSVAVDKVGRDAMLLIGQEFVQSFDETFMAPTNSWALTYLISRIGKNKAYPSAATPTAAAPIIEIDAYDGAGVPKKEFFEFIGNTKMSNNSTGDLIVVGGLTLFNYMNLFGILPINGGTFDFAKMYGSFGVEFYFDETIETVMGAGSFICFDTGAAFAETFCYHDFPKFVDTSGSDDTVDDKLGVNLVKFNDPEAALANGAESYIRMLDLRVTKKRDSNDFSNVNFTPSLAAGRYCRPLGYFTNQVGNIMKDVTGVFGGKLI